MISSQYKDRNRPLVLLSRGPVLNHCFNLVVTTIVYCQRQQTPSLKCQEISDFKTQVGHRIVTD